MEGQPTGVDSDPEGKSNRLVLLGYLLLGPLVPVLLIIGLMLILKSAERDGVMACLSQGGVLHVEKGVIRHAGPDLFVQSDRWRKIAYACGGRSRARCLDNNPGVDALMRNIGREVSVEFCGKHVVAYRVAGWRYEQVPLPEELLKGAP